MKIRIIGGGPAGLTFALLMKRADPSHDVAVFERNRPDDTFGFGVVFSDATLDKLAEADRETYDEITRSFAHWDDIEIHYRGTVLRTTGHGFSGLSRMRLLNILQTRCESLGVRQEFQAEADLERCSDADLVVAADGVNSAVRTRWAEHFRPEIDWRPNRFVWLGTTAPFTAFTFIFKEDPHGLWRVHAYRYEPERSTFIVETTETAWRRAGLEKATEDETVAFCERLFAEELKGHRLLKNRSLWRSFPVVRCGRWGHENVVLIGDAAHTAHFSIGSGTKLAMESAIALRDAFVRGGGVERYEEERRSKVENWQSTARASLEWFENTERYARLEPLPFAMSLLTRSLRVTHENLKARDPKFVAEVDREFGGAPAFVPFRLRELLLPNRIVVAPMCQYSAEDGTPNDWHLVHLGSRAIGGAGLLMAEMTDVSREGRITPGCTGMYEPGHVAAWKRIVDFVHRNGPSKIGLQLGHAGRKGSTRPAWEGEDEPLADGNWPLLSSSPIAFLPRNQVPREMTRDDMVRVREEFVRAVRWADEADFDLVELHFAHGYLLSSFLSPLANVRKDEYGGSLENRLRYPLEVFDAARAAWPKPKPMAVRISATDWAPGGFGPADAVEVGRALKAHGCDIVDVSAGFVIGGARPVGGRVGQVLLSERVRLEAEVPTMAVGGFASLAEVNTVLTAGRADLCVVGRATLADPYWFRHAAAGLGIKLPWPRPYDIE